MLHTTRMRVALVHDYIKEFGGAERVLRVLGEMFPEAPIYTAFSVKNSTAEKEFRGREIRESRLAPLLKIWKLYSPLRFLTPWVWGSFDLSEYDLVITSCSWYITRGFKISPKTKVVAYCHTPPRWLYGYETSVGFTKYWPVKVYSAIVGHFMRMYDFKTAQPIARDRMLDVSIAKLTAGVDFFIANSENVKQRIEKFYRRDASVIYPPVDVEEIKKTSSVILRPKAEESKYINTRSFADAQDDNNKKYFLIVSRLVGAKGLEEAAKTFKQFKNKYKLKIVGEAAGFSDVAENLKRLSGDNVELLGRLDDVLLYRTYSQAKGFIALARDEDFGMTVVEAMATGTPVIAFNGGGFKETVVEGVTGILINDTNEKTILNAVKRFEKIKWDRKKIQKNAEKFSKEVFDEKMKKMITKTLRDTKTRS